MGIRRFVFAAAVVAALSVAASAQLEWDKSRADRPLPNPSRVSLGRDAAVAAAKRVLEKEEFVVKSATTDERTGLTTILTESRVFARGLVADTQFDHYAELGASDVRGIVRGRVVLRVEVAPTNVSTVNVGVYGTFEGLAEGAVGSAWVQSRSRGVLEDNVLRAVVASATGADPESIQAPPGSPDLPEREGEDDTPVSPRTQQDQQPTLDPAPNPN